jgi:hypothetical protein
MKSTATLRRLRLALSCGIILSCLSVCLAQDSTDIVATRISHPPTIDGVLNEAVWQTGVVTTRFVQKNPVESAQPSQKTEVIVLYDDDALYVGARMYDTAPDSIIGRLVRRDQSTESDGFAFYLDSYHDHLSAYNFGLNPAGTRYDAYYYNDRWSDDSWEGVWDGQVSTDSLGWTAEFRIPWSQLRFHRQAKQVWGVNFMRYIGRHAEDDHTSFMPKSENGFVSRFGHLTGIEDIPTPHYVELLPYVRGRALYQVPAAGDPFTSKSEYVPALGGDAKIGIGPDLILNATVNPDFGQVEVDPAVVNLTDVETYFNEKRPFFVEGSKIFDFGQGGATDYWGFNWNSPQPFYSRRIGRAPQGQLASYDFAKIPEGARIIGAAKLTGNIGRHWSIGSLHAMTLREFGDVQTNGVQSHPEVEPATYYMVTRAQREIEGGLRGIGGMVTAAHRFFSDPKLKSDINGDAYTGGVDGWTALDRSKTYVLGGWAGMSDVLGSRDRLTALQRSSTHYFQRPDAAYLGVDSNASSLTGYAARMYLNKEKGNVYLNGAAGLISPGYDVNDLGYLNRADQINAHLGSGYKWSDMTAWTRWACWQAAWFETYDFGGNSTGRGIWTGATIQLRDNSTLSGSAVACPSSYSHSRTRGGPLTVNTAGWNSTLDLASDVRRSWVFGLGGSENQNAADDFTRTAYVSAEWKPVMSVSLKISPQVTEYRDPIAWVGSIGDVTATRTYGQRYVFANLKQTELSSSIRVDWTFTPKLSLQVYAQPLISAGLYTRYKELVRPGSNDYSTYPAQDIQYDAAAASYTVDPDGAAGPAQSFSFSQPDFNIRSLRGNVVLRWEYLRGSTLFLVWTHGRFNYESNGAFNFHRSWDRLLDSDSDNIIMLKATYWVSW